MSYLLQVSPGEERIVTFSSMYIQNIRINKSYINQKGEINKPNVCMLYYV